MADPRRGFAEIARILKPGGCHVFTVPWNPGDRTRERARLVNGSLQHLQAPQYHGDPVDASGSLVFTDFGSDIADIIRESGGMQTTILQLKHGAYGIEGDVFLFHSSRPAHTGNKAP